MVDEYRRAFDDHPPIANRWGLLFVLALLANAVATSLSTQAVVAQTPAGANYDTVKKSPDKP